VVSAGTYILSVLALAAVGLSLGFTAYRLRQKLLSAWNGAPARLVEAVVAIALLIWLGEILGTVGLFYDWALVGSAVLIAAASAVLPRVLSQGEGGTAGRRAVLDPPPPAPPAGEASWLAWTVTIGVITLVFAHWGLTTKDALDRGIFNFDSLWYHMPFAADMVQSHSVTGLHYPETVFTNWFYPQNSELLHATGILLTHRDTLSLFLNFSFLGIAFLAAWCIGRPYGRAHLAVVAAAIVLECHTLVVREPGAAKNDLMAAALLLAAAAILVNALPPRQDPRASEAGGTTWALAAAGLATGLAVGTKSTAVAMAAALTLAVIALAPTGRRWATFGWWFVPALLGGGYWYLRNLIVAGNPLPQATSIGPISLPHPERLQEGRPNFNIVHYLTDTGVWREYFAPGLHQAFGILWPLVLAAAVAGALLALFRARDDVLRWMGAVDLFGLLAYLFTPLSAAGAEGAPVGFAINIRYAIPPLLLALTLLPVALLSADGPQIRLYGVKSAHRRAVWGWGLLAALVLVLVATDRSDAVLRDPARLFAWGLAFLVVVVPAGLLLARARGAGRGVVAGGFVALALLVVAIGYPVQRHYLEHRFLNDVPEEERIPGANLDSAYAWARDVGDARIGLAGTTAGFLQYGFYGTDLSNRVVYLGEKGPHGAYNAIPTCTAFRTAANAADLDYLVTTPFLNFIDPNAPIPSPEAKWLRNDPATKPLLRSGPVTVWKLEGKLNPEACGPANAPLHRIPNTPKSQAQ
jgi:4-amino-4-deoxy-L-arabinose transferase-like glycosyltransferase